MHAPEQPTIHVRHTTGGAEDEVRLDLVPRAILYAAESITYRDDVSEGNPSSWGQEVPVYDAGYRRQEVSMYDAGCRRLLDLLSKPSKEGSTSRLGC